MDKQRFNPEEYWDAKHRINYPGLFVPTELAKRSLPYFKRNAVGSLLEIGCGRSGDSCYFASKGISVVGLDISFIALADLSAHIPNHSLLLLIQSDLCNGFPFRANSFDAVFSRLSLHYFSDQTTKFIFSEIIRILNDNGCIAISVKSEQQQDISLQKANLTSNDHPRNLFTVRYAESLLKEYSRVRIRENKIVSGMKMESPIIEVFAKK